MRPVALSEYKPGSVLGLPTPLARLYGAAMIAGIAVRDFPGACPFGDDRTAAVVSVGGIIALNPALGDELRADVLAMALGIATVMTGYPSGDPGEVYAPSGVVVITGNRIPAPRAGPGAFATVIAQRCGRDTTSAAFEYYPPSSRAAPRT
jgi:hypothetical protein